MTAPRHLRCRAVGGIRLGHGSRWCADRVRGWRSVFLINVPIVLFACVVARKFLEESRDTKHPAISTSPARPW
ncbi:hypothetical protein [Kibdelosporangium philippinense]|uniref:hypothetical protein n=1 Tax=Kibdelosporangium philippinense TaxID=211113 RepID=UPI00361ED4D9